jgi:5'(3')-deoxyribonucleotidase
MARVLEVAIDLDDTLVALWSAWLAEYNRRSGTKLTQEDMSGWDKPHEYPGMFDVIRQPGFFLGLQAMPGAADALDRMLCLGWDPYIVSNATGHAIGDKAALIEKLFPMMVDRTYLAHRFTKKTHFTADAVIDDGPHNHVAIRKRHPEVFLTGMFYPYTTLEAMYACDSLYSWRDPAAAWKHILADLVEFAEGSPQLPLLPARRMEA